MNRYPAMRSRIKAFLAAIFCFMLPGLSWADLSNTASAIFKDSAGNSYSATSNTVTVTVTTTPVIVLQKSASPTTAKSGDTVTFTIQYQNTSTGIASNVVITDVVPTGSTLVAGSITGGGTLSGTTISWNLGTVTGSTSGTVSFQTKVN
jgi:uncharacterized repeat protein (TIGR01451 family)